MCSISVSSIHLQGRNDYYLVGVLFTGFVDTFPEEKNETKQGKTNQEKL